MRRARVERAVLQFISSLAAARCLNGQSVLPVGHEFQVNSYTTFDQQGAAVSKNPAGDFVVTWFGLGAGGDPNGDIALRRYDSAGVPQSSEFLVSAFTYNTERYPSVASDNSGNFVVVWMSNDRDGSEEGVFARRFDAAGTPQAIELQVNSYTLGSQRDPTVAVDDDGNAVIVWSSPGDGSAFGVFGRRLDSTGSAVATEFQVNVLTTDFQASPAVAMRANGSFVVAWQSLGQDGNSFGIFARRFDTLGLPLGTEFQANTFTIGPQVLPAVAAQGDGDFVIAWECFGQDSDGQGVFARPFDASGAPKADEFLVNVSVVGNQRLPTIATDELGTFVVAWQGQQDGSDYGIFARRFSPSGVGLEAEFQVATYTAGAQRYPSVDIDGEGDFVIAWDSSDQDGDAIGVFARRFITLAVLDVDADQKVAPLTDGLLTLRFLFGFTGTPLTTAALGVDCTRCAPGAIASYLAALGTVLDVDGNGTPGPLTDGLLILRYLFGFTNDALVTGAVGGGCTRCTADPLEAHIKLLTV